MCRNASQLTREKGFRLLQRKAQVAATQFVQMPLGLPPGKRELRIGAAGEHQVHLGRQMLDQPFEQAVHLARANAMIIIQHQEQVFRYDRPDRC